MRPLALFSDLSLTTKLLFLTIIFVFIAELLVMVPSVANQRMKWFEQRIEAAYLVSAALEGPRGALIEEEAARTLFSTANILGVTVKRGSSRMLVLAPEIDPHGAPNMHRVDTDDLMPLVLIANAWATIFSDGEALIQVTGAPRFAPDQTVDIVVSQASLRMDLREYARNILGLSLIISTVTAALLFLALNAIIVRPVRNLTGDMIAFEADPDKPALIHRPSGRADEIGAAERSLSAMQKSLYELLAERRRLAALGAGISKISHDLRNILASAQLMSDRLAKSDDPRVRKLSPRLIQALDRAISLSRDTLTFGGMEAGKLQKTNFNLHELIGEALDDAPPFVRTRNNAAPDLVIHADRNQLFRAVLNLSRNAIEAMSATETGDNQQKQEADGAGDARLTISGERIDDDVVIAISDTGPGVPEHAVTDLFEPFKGSKKPGGSGLGLAIACEIARAHKGELVLSRNTDAGAEFTIRLPGAAIDAPAAREEGETV